MTVFMRTPSGLRNLAKFYAADVTVYIEGRCHPDGQISENTVTYDELYYRAILKEINSSLSYVIKVVGCKDSVTAYAQQIRENDIKNCISIVDRDWEGLVSSWLPDPRLVHTYGYSWENDFWTTDLIIQTLHDLTPSIRGFDDGKVREMIERAAHRLARIAKIDCLAKLHGIKFIPSNKNSTGVEIQPSHHFLTPATEIRKYNKNVKPIRGDINKCPVSRDMHVAIVNESAEKIIRGHLWEFSSICILSYFYKLFSGEKSIPKYLVKGAAFNAFSHAVNRFLTPNVAGHYRVAVGEALAAAAA